MFRRSRGRTRLTVSAALTVALLWTAVGCGSSGGGNPQKYSPDDLKKPTTLTLWTYIASAKDQVKLFEQKYPAIKVKIVNPGTATQLVPKLRAAITANNGAPDVSLIEAQTLPSFAVSGSLLDLSSYGATSLQPKFAPFAWSQVTDGSRINAVPVDAGPLGLVYRKDIFDKYGLTVPKTWAEFLADAKKLHAEAPNVKMADFPNSEGGLFNALMWQAGSHPFDVTSKTSINIKLNDAGARRAATMLQSLISAGLVGTDPDFTDQWNRELSDGTYACLVGAAWLPFFLTSSAPTTSGRWRVASLPQYGSGSGAPVSANWGGSTYAVMKGTKNPTAAATLAEFLGADEHSAKISANANLYPTTTQLLNDTTWRGAPNAFYGGQAVNAVFAEMAAAVPTHFSFSPFQDTVYQQFTETVGKAMSARQNLVKALDQWQAAVVSYAKQQGFTVTTN